MIYDVLNVIKELMELMVIYLGVNLIRKYVFLEPEMEKPKQKKYQIVSVAIILLSYIVLKADADIVALLATALNISLSRKHKRIGGFFIIFPIIGFLNGLVVPVWGTPKVVCRMTFKEELFFSIILYSVILLSVLIFYLKSIEWRAQFEKDVTIRSLTTWERVLLVGVGAMLLLYSCTYLELPTTELAAQIVINEIIVDKIIGSVVVFGLTIIVIVLILQGNKKEQYYKKTEIMSKQMVNALAKTIDAKDKYTNGHSTRVAKYSVMIAKRMGYEGDKLEQLEFAALLHDIGKIGVPREIINKPTRLTDEEYEIIKTHPGTGANILKEVTEIPDIIIGARWHHERFDGKGYPDKLEGFNIPEIARIIGVADAYDAMTSKRSYRDVLAQEIVRGEIENGKGTQFDPQIADIMLVLIDEDKEYVMHE